MTLVLLLLACSGSKPQPDKVCPAPPCDSTTDTSTVGDGGGGSPTDGGGTEEPEPIPDAAGFEILAIDTETLSASGLEIVTIGFTEDHVSGLRYLDDSLPRFYVFRRAGGGPGTDPAPTVIWLHGGGVVNDTAGAHEHCTFEHADSLAYNGFLAGRLSMPYGLAQRGMVMVVPVAPWCDMWVGLGDADPVDTQHRGLAYLDAVLDGMVFGLGQTRVDPESISLWGSSLGGGGVFPVARHWLDRGIRATSLISDSGPVDLVAMGDSRGSTLPYTFLQHVLGGALYDDEGALTEYAANWMRAAPLLILESDDFDLPLFEIHNQLDTLTPSFNGLALTQAVERLYPARGGRFFLMDANTRTPGEQYHTQTSSPRAPGTYTTEAAFRFIEGYQVAYFEAEELCEEGSCTVESGEEAEVGHALTRHFNQTAAVWYESQGAGTVARLNLPERVRGDHELLLATILDTVNVDPSVTGDMLLLRVLQGEREVLRQVIDGRLLRSSDVGVSLSNERIQTSTLALPASEVSSGEPLVLQIDALVGVELYIEGVWAFWKD